jgi:hypothetical protein
MRAFRITITMPDGSQGQHEGLYADSIDATLESEKNFPQACRIEVQALHSARAAQMCAHRAFRGQLSAAAQGERA